MERLNIEVNTQSLQIKIKRVKRQKLQVKMKRVKREMISRIKIVDEMRATVEQQWYSTKVHRILY